MEFSRRFHRAYTACLWRFHGVPTASMEFSRRFHRAYTARLWRFHGVPTASMEFSRRFHRAYTARLWRFHGVLFILQCSRGVCKASRRSWRSRGASTASYGVLMIKASHAVFLKANVQMYETLFLFCLQAVRAVLKRRGSAVRTPWKRGANDRSAAQTL